ncbi:MAG: CHAT domain-containing protein, partial [Myxococcota bacterium]
GVSIINGIPNNSQELIEAKIEHGKWSDWEGIYSSWQSIIDNHNFTSQVTVNDKTNKIVEEALKHSENILIIIAHSDGQTIYFPDGSFLETSDIEKIREDIAKNRPLVALFSCETARMENGLASFSQTLIESGAKAVVAPVSEIGARSTSRLLDQALQNSTVGDSPIEAIWKAIQDTGITGLENPPPYHRDSRLASTARDTSTLYAPEPFFVKAVAMVFRTDLKSCGFRGWV